MPNSSDLSSQLFRTDPQIGCGNLLSFSEQLSRLFGAPLRSPLSLISVEVDYQAKRGPASGDATIRWIGIALMEDMNAPVFRIGGHEFVVILVGGGPVERAERARQIYERLNNEASQFGLQPPVARVAVIHYAGNEQFFPADVLMQISASVFEIKASSEQSFKIFEAAALNTGGNPSAMRWITNLMVNRMVSMGMMLDEAQRLAYTDPVTNLPNVRAARQRLENTLTRAASTERPFSVLLIASDDLRQYNHISYAAGDEMMQNIGRVLAENLRPGDFLARWQWGARFVIILPTNNAEQSVPVGERLGRVISAASKDWRIPVTVSIGIAVYPKNGRSEKDLLQAAENACRQAGLMGKNRIVVS